MVGFIDNIKVIGSPVSTGVVAEVDSTSRALKSTLRANDVTAGGSYSLSTSFNITYSSTAVTAVPIWAFQWKSHLNFMLLKKMILQVGITTAAATAGTNHQFQMFFADGFIRQYDTFNPDGTTNVWQQTNWSSITLGIGNKLRNTFLQSDAAGYLGADIANATIPTGGGGVAVGNATLPGATVVMMKNGAPIATSTQLQNGINTLDAQPMGALATSNIIGVNSPQYFAPAVLHDTETGYPPYVLANFSGFVLKYTNIVGTANGTVAVTVNMEWDEVPSYSLGLGT